jgi:glycosyltransferase involved in cell wall biosynthesis
MKILCPTYWYPEHATDIHATYVHDINRHLVSLGHKVRVVTPGNESMAAREEFDGVEVVRFPINLPPDLSYGKVAQGTVSPLAKLKRLVTMATYLRKQYRAAVVEGREFGADVLHGHWAIPTGPAIVSAARKLGVPSVITMHGGDVYVNEEQGYNFANRAYVKPILKWTLRKANALTAISEDCRQHALNAGAHDENMEIVMNGADLRRFSPPENAHAKARYGNQMVFACRQLFPRKGIRFLVEATANLKDEFPELRVVVAGDGIEREELIQQAESLGIRDRVQFLGWVPNAELPEYYRSARFSVIPSLEEGFGIPAAEAMGCEIPVIASDAGGLPEVVEDNVTGFIVPKGDVPALTDKMRVLLSDESLCREMGAAGRLRALRRFDWLNTAEAFVRTYERIGANAGDKG